MAVDERRRVALYDSLRRLMSDDDADTLMGLLPTTGDVATRDDVERLREAVVGQIAAQDASLRSGMLGMEARLREEMAELRTELRTGLADVRAESRTGLASVRTEMAELRTETGTGVAGVRTEMAELRTETRTGLAGVRIEMADLRAELHATMTANQRQVMFGLFAAMAANAGVVWAAMSAAG